MWTLIWLIVSVIILTITIWVHSHTYGVTSKHIGEYIADLNDPAPFPMWLLIGGVVVSFIPIINVGLFLIGARAWLIHYTENDIRLGNLPKWFKSVQEFLTRQV